MATKVLATKYSGTTDGSKGSFELVIQHEGQEARITLALQPSPGSQDKADWESRMNDAYRQFVSALQNAEGLPLKI